MYTNDSSMDAKQALRNFVQFNTLTDIQLHHLSHCIERKTASKGGFIYEEGIEKSHVYLLDKGSVKLASHTGDDKMLIKDIVTEKSFFGENIFAGNSVRKEFAEALTDVVYFQIPGDHIRKLAENNGAFADQMLELIMTKLYDLEERLQNFVFKSAKERIMYFIKRTGERNGIKIGIDECLINHGMSHKEIAFLTDTSRQTVARVLSELKRTNIIHFSPRKPNKILIRDMAAIQSA